MQTTQSTFYTGILLLLCVFSAKAQYLWQLNEDTIVTWYYQDGDEFNNNEVDREKWSTAYTWGRTVIGQDLYYTDGEDMEENGGVLKLYLNKRDYPVKLGFWDKDTAYLKKNKIVLKNDTFPFKYTAGLICSKAKYKNGYFEIRFKTPKNGKGMWPAFWTYGGNKNDEIDFFEMKGEKDNYFHVDVHCPDGCSNYPAILGTHKDWGGWVKTDNYFQDGFNTISGEWGKGYIKWYLNGKGIATFKGNFETAMNIITQMSIAKDNGAFSPGPDNTTVYPGIMEVDYIRIWSREKPLRAESPFTMQAYANGNNSMQLKSNKLNMKQKKKFLYGNSSAYKQEGATVSLVQEEHAVWLISLLGNGNNNLSVSVTDNKDQVLFKKEDQQEEFLRVDLNGNRPGKYTFTIAYKGKQIKQDVYIMGK